MTLVRGPLAQRTHPLQRPLQGGIAVRADEHDGQDDLLTTGGAHEGFQLLATLIVGPVQHDGLDHAGRPGALPRLGIAGGREHLLIVGEARVVRQEFVDALLQLGRIAGEREEGMADELGTRPALARGAAFQGGQSGIAQVGCRAEPAHGALGDFASQFEGNRAQCRNDDGHLRPVVELCVHLEVFAVEIGLGTGEQALHHSHEFAQMTERLSVGDAVAAFHHGGVTGTEAEHETPWSQLRNVGGLLRHHQRMPRKGGDDGGAHSHGSRGGRRGGEHRQAIGTGAGGEPYRRHSRRLRLSDRLQHGRGGWLMDRNAYLT